MRDLDSKLAVMTFIVSAVGLAACSGADLASLSKGSENPLGPSTPDAEEPRPSDGGSAHERSIPPWGMKDAANAEGSAAADAGGLDAADAAPDQMLAADATDAAPTGDAGVASDAAPTPDANVTFWVRGVLIKNMIQDLRADVAGDHVSNDQELMQWPPNGSLSQRWDFAEAGVTSEGQRVYQIINQNSSKCVEVQNGTLAPRWRLTQHDCNRSLLEQQWALLQVNPNLFVLRNVRTQLCADLEDGSGNSGTPIVQNTCQDWASQRWSLVTK
jgi:hypothetical protein